MSRSNYKLPYIHRSVFAKSIQRRENFFKTMSFAEAKLYFGELLADKKKLNVPLHFFFWKRYSTINKNLSTKKICLYGGKTFIVIPPHIARVGFKLGQFVITRKQAYHSKQKKRQIKKVKAKVVKVIKYFT